MLKETILKKYNANSKTNYQSYEAMLLGILGDKRVNATSVRLVVEQMGRKIFYKSVKKDLSRLQEARDRRMIEELSKEVWVDQRRSPCIKCKLKDKNKTTTVCVKCEKRIEYLELMNAA